MHNQRIKLTNLEILDLDKNHGVRNNVAPNSISAIFREFGELVNAFVEIK